MKCSCGKEIDSGGDSYRCSACKSQARKEYFPFLESTQPSDEVLREIIIKDCFDYGTCFDKNGKQVICEKDCDYVKRMSKAILSLARLVLSASEEVPGEKTYPLVFNLSGGEAIPEQGYREGWNAYRQAVLPVVAKKDLIIADLKHDNQCLKEALEQAHSYWKSAENKVAEQAKRIEDLERKVKE